MKLIDINWHPSDKQLRQFGLACLVAFPLLAWVWHGASQVILGAIGIGAGCVVLGWLFPRVLRPLYLGLSVMAAPIGLIVGELFLLLVFFGVMLPIGLLFRLQRRDALQLKSDKTVATYWQSKKQPKNASSYFRQF